MSWNGSGGAETPSAGTPPKGRARAARLAAALGVALALAVVGVRFAARPAPERCAPAPDASAARPIPAARPAAPEPVRVAAPEPAGRPAPRLWNGVEVVSSAGAETNRDGAVVERLVLADGRRVRAVTLPGPVFRNASDQLLAMLVSARPGEEVPPLPLGPGIERAFAESLASPDEGEPGDSDAVRELRRRVRDARRAVAEEVRAGRSVREVLAAYQGELAFIAESRLAAVREAQVVREADGEEAARRFAERANEALRARGVPEIPVPGEGRRSRERGAE